MTRGQYKKILKDIARREGVSIKTVEREMQQAINNAFDNPDELVRKEWMKIPFKGERPTVEEVMEALSKKVNMEK